MKTKFFLYFATSIIFCSCQKNNDIEPNSYLNKWLGIYEGTSHLWSSYPGSDFTNIRNDYYYKAKVDVVKSSLDSSLNLTITYNDSIINSLNDLKFSSSGHHFSEWGSGSGYGSLTIEFMSDSLHYLSYQKCGIPCNVGAVFWLVKR